MRNIQPEYQKPKGPGFLEEIGKAFIFKKWRPGLREYLQKAGITDVPYSFFGGLFFVGIVATFIFWLSTNFYASIKDEALLLVGLYTLLFWLIGLIASISIIIAGIYFYFNMRIFNRTKVIEDSLPDYLVLVSTNLKGGLSFEKSLWASIKPEFGILAEEMSIVSKRVMTGNDLTEALIQFGNKYDSPIIKRTINIIIGEVESGGQVAKVLDQIIENLRKTRILKDEMAANTLMFTIFIGAIVIVISPLLFALAFNLLKILISVSAQIAPAMEQAGSTGAPFKISKVGIDIDEFKTFSFLALSIIAIFSSMILSIIQRGDVRSGIKYVPFFVASSVLLYFIFMGILGGLFTMF